MQYFTFVTAAQIAAERFRAAVLLLEFRAKRAGDHVSNDKTHRGIFYSIRRLSEQRWKWEIEPPECIKGLRTENGEVEGERTDAVAAAHKAIDIQTEQFMH